MKRIDVIYGGQLYSVANREVDELRDEIVRQTQNGAPHWLLVNSGEGQPRPTYLLITPGTSLALTPIPDENPPSED